MAHNLIGDTYRSDRINPAKKLADSVAVLNIRHYFSKIYYLWINEV